MKLRFSFGPGAMVLPAALADVADRATKKDLRVLLTLAADPIAAVDLDAAVAAAAAKLSLAVGEVETALAFWRGAGILQGDDDAAEEKSAPAPHAPRPPQGLPGYSAAELSDIIERREGFRHLLDACQQAFGKIFNTAEVNIVVGMLDYLGMSGEYILLLLAHCARMEKKSLRYAEKLALSLFDEGVTDAQALEERLHRIEQMSDAIGKIRAMFGMSSRELTTKEKNMIEKWVCVMQYGDEMLRRAYELTVDSTGKPSVAYANSILERWYAAGYKTVAEVDEALREYRAAKGEPLTGKFDANSAFESALMRTYGKKNDGI